MWYTIGYRETSQWKYMSDSNICTICGLTQFLNIIIYHMNCVLQKPFENRLKDMNFASIYTQTQMKVVVKLLTFLIEYIALSVTRYWTPSASLGCNCFWGTRGILIRVKVYFCTQCHLFILPINKEINLYKFMNRLFNICLVHKYYVVM